MEHDGEIITVHYRARGRVQRIMFRQTMIRAALKRGLEAGVSNNPRRRDIVYIALKGTAERIKDMVEWLTSGKDLNNWGSRVDALEEEHTSRLLVDYQVNTNNVNDFNWNPNIVMYL